MISDFRPGALLRSSAKGKGFGRRQLLSFPNAPIESIIDEKSLQGQCRPSTISIVPKIRTHKAANCGCSVICRMDGITFLKNRDCWNLETVKPAKMKDPELFWKIDRSKDAVPLLSYCALVVEREVCAIDNR